MSLRLVSLLGTWFSCLWNATSFWNMAAGHSYLNDIYFRVLFVFHYLLLFTSFRFKGVAPGERKAFFVVDLLTRLALITIVKESPHHLVTFTATSCDSCNVSSASEFPVFVFFLYLFPGQLGRIRQGFRYMLW